MGSERSQRVLVLCVNFLVLLREVTLHNDFKVKSNSEDGELDPEMRKTVHSATQNQIFGKLLIISRKGFGIRTCKHYG